MAEECITFTHRWIITNYCQLYDKILPWEGQIASNTFSPPNNQSFKFELSLYPKGKNCDTCKDYLSIGVRACYIPEICERKIGCGWKVSIEDSNGNKCGTKLKESYFLFHDEKRIDDFIEYSTLLDCASKYLPRDQLTLHFKIHLRTVKPIFSNIDHDEPVGQSRFDCAKRFIKMNHTWTNFSLDSNQDVTPLFIQSYPFSVVFDKQKVQQFRLRLYPNGCTSESESVAMGIWSDSANTSTTSVQYRISILDGNGKECNSKVGNGKIDANEDTIVEYINRANLLELNSNPLVRDNKLKIYFEMSFLKMDSDFKDDKKFTDLSQMTCTTDITYPRKIHYVTHQWTIDKLSVLCPAVSLRNSEYIPRYPNEPISSIYRSMFRETSPEPEDITPSWIHSETFQPSTEPRCAFNLRLSHSGHDNYRRHYLSLYLCNVSSQVSKVSVQYRISILGINGEKIVKYANQSTIENNLKCAKSPFLTISNTKNESSSKMHYKSEDKVTIICEIWVLDVYYNETDKSKVMDATDSEINQSQVKDLSVPKTHKSKVKGTTKPRTKQSKVKDLSVPKTHKSKVKDTTKPGTNHPKVEDLKTNMFLNPKLFPTLRQMKVKISKND